MLTYQVRPRVFRTLEGGRLRFPNSAVVEMRFLPQPPFGGATGPGRTVSQGEPATVLMNLNSGRQTAESENPFDRVDVTIQDDDLLVRCIGNLLRLEGLFGSMDELNRTIETAHYLLPVLFTLDFVDVPVVSTVSGNVGDVPFSWELPAGSDSFEVTNTEQQERRILDAWSRFAAVTPPRHRRVAAALNYFHVACRLERVGHTPWEFLSETLLNLAKVLETLFPPEARTGSIDAARRGLRELGFDDAAIERDYIPVIALRNALDVGHPSLAIYRQNDLQTLHSFCEGVELPFRVLLQEVADRLSSGTLALAPYNAMKPDKNAIRIIRRLRSNMPKAPATEPASSPKLNRAARRNSPLAQDAPASPKQQKDKGR